MGRIEEALQKLQNAGRRQGDQPNAATLPPQLASLVPLAPDYSGKRVVFDVAALANNVLLAPGPDERRLSEQ